MAEGAMGKPDFIIRPAECVEEVTELWWPLMKELGWNRDRDDAITHFHVARQGADWLILESKETGKPEGCVISFTYPNGTGWVGFFIVNESFRGKGYGRELWKRLETSFAASGTTIVGLDAVKQQVPTYERRGFKVITTMPLMTRPSLLDKPVDISEPASIGTDTKLEDLKSVDAKLLAQLDLSLTGLDRSALWTPEALFNREDTYGFALLSSSSDTSKLLGYILVRRCERGHRFGPLYAETYDQARLLLHKAMCQLSQSPGSFITEVFGSNAEGKKVFEELGWAWSGIDYHRMWLGGRVPEAQQDGGRGTTEMFAAFDASGG